LHHRGRSLHQLRKVLYDSDTIWVFFVMSVYQGAVYLVVRSS
jgi:hypothetical protein